MRRFAIVLALCFALAGSACAAPQLQREKILTLDPVLGLIVKFIGGPYLDVAFGWTFDSRGAARYDRRSIFNGENAALPLLAFDPQGYSRYATSSRRGKAGVLTKAELSRENVHFLFPNGRPNGDELFFTDPANLPYTAQLAADILSELVPSRSVYFQRRIGEFDAHLSSLLILGRRRLRGAKILYFGKDFSPLLLASGCELSSPTAQESASLRSMTQASTRKAAEAAAEQLAAGRIIAFDNSLDQKQRDALSRWAHGVYLSLSNEGEFFVELHNAILDLGTALDRLKTIQQTPKAPPRSSSSRKKS